VASAAVKWGVTSEGRDGWDHCAFSSQHVRLPEVGRLYAGTMPSSVEKRRDPNYSPLGRRTSSRTR
jgi:hypothetical protein